MRLYPKSMYSVHIDKSPRFHIVITPTQVVSFYGPTGMNYYTCQQTDTYTIPTLVHDHTFCNSGDHYRDHIVFQSDRLMEDYKGTWERLPKDTPRGVL